VHYVDAYAWYFHPGPPGYTDVFFEKDWNASANVGYFHWDTDTLASGWVAATSPECAIGGEVKAQAWASFYLGEE